MKWPLFNKTPHVPVDGSVASFAHKRSYYYHPGVDLYCDAGQYVVAIEDSKVINIEIFTGPNANPVSAWWNETWAVLVEGASGVLGYCELKPLPYIKKGFKLKAGIPIGNIIPVLKRDKDNGTTMLHLEMYKPKTSGHVTWHIGEDRPETLLDPTEFLRNIK